MNFTLTDLIALYGAVVATIVGAVQIRNLRPHVVVTVERVWISDSDGCLSDEELCVQATNVGTRSMGFGALPSLFCGKVGMIFTNPHSSDDTFPRDLQPGASCKVFINPLRLAESLKKSGAHGIVNLRGRYVDETRRTYWSCRFSFNVDSPLLPEN